MKSKAAYREMILVLGITVFLGLFFFIGFISGIYYVRDLICR